MDNRKFPKYLRIDRSKKDKIEDLKGSISSPFYKMNGRDIVFFAAAIGAFNNTRLELKDKEDLTLYSDLPENYKVLADVIALKSVNYDFDKIIDGKLVLDAVEEYANAGISTLQDLVMSNLSTSDLEEKIFEILQELTSIKST